VNRIAFVISFSTCCWDRKAIGFCTLIFFYPVTLPNVFISSKRFLMESLWYFIYWIISRANRNNVTSSFPVCIPFISFSYLIDLAKDSSSILKKSGESRFPCIVSDFKVNGFCFFPFIMMLAISLLYITFIMWRYFLPFLLSSRFLSWVVEFCQRHLLHTLR
jgi:hypothetical protein